MPQLDNLIFFNEMINLILGFTVFYILFLRVIIVKLAYILKIREKFFNKKISEIIKTDFVLIDVNNFKSAYKTVNYSKALIIYIQKQISMEIEKVIKMLKEVK